MASFKGEKREGFFIVLKKKRISGQEKQLFSQLEEKNRDKLLKISGF